MATTFKGDGFIVESGVKDGKFTITVTKDVDNPDNGIVSKYKAESGEVKGLTMDKVRKNIEELFSDETSGGLNSHLVIPKSFPSFMDHFIKNAAIDLKSKATAALGREPLPHEMDFAFDGHSVSALLRRDPDGPKFKVGQSVFFFGSEGRFWNGVITSIGNTEALVKGKGLAWLPFESLHSTLDEAYEAKEIEDKAAKERTDRLSRAQSFKIGQEAYFIALDCGVYTALKCSIIDMGEYEASIKLSAVVRRSVVESKDVFHTCNEANDEIFIRQQILNSRG